MLRSYNLPPRSVFRVRFGQSSFEHGALNLAVFVASDLLRHLGLRRPFKGQFNNTCSNLALTVPEIMRTGMDTSSTRNWYVGQMRPSDNFPLTSEIKSLA